MRDIVILGTGMAGFGAAHRLRSEGRQGTVFDKNPYFGGHTFSQTNEQGFTFDIGPHISFTKDERIQELFAESVNQEYLELQINLNNYFEGYWLTHPVQLHLHGLPHDLIVEVIGDFVAEKKSPERPIGNYEEWLVASFGRKFAETFPMRYTRKYHLTEACNLSTDWLGPRFYRPSLDEMLRGALTVWEPEKHYISHFRYPERGGFFSYMSLFPKLADLQLGYQAVGIDQRSKVIRFANGSRVEYRGLVSSVPLTKLIPMIDDVPLDVREAASKLACSTCVLVNLGIDRSDLSKAHMSYVYDEDVCFTRLSFPHMLSANNVPIGCGSIQAEIYFSNKYRPLQDDAEAWIEPTIEDLKKCGVLTEDDKVLTREAGHVEHANIIFDLDRASALETVHGFLRDVGIDFCGRYGDWGYMWTDESFISGERAAERALSRIGSQDLKKKSS
jgi:protoporphyrinogen oxidase